MIKENNCLFCNNPEHVVAETDNFYIKVGKSIVAEGHVMIISKEHLKAIFAMNDSLLNEFITLKDKLTKFLQDRYFDPFIVEHGGVMQSVFHGHMHFVPRKSNFYNKQDQFKNMVEDYLKKHEEIKYEDINNLNRVLDIFKEDNEYLYFEQGNKKLVIRTKLLTKKYIEDNIEKQLNYRRFYYNLTGKKALLSWHNMTEEDVELDEINILNTKNMFKKYWK